MKDILENWCSWNSKTQQVTFSLNNTCGGVNLLVNLQAPCLQLYKKRTSPKFFLRIWPRFLEYLFSEQLSMATSIFLCL